MIAHPSKAPKAKTASRAAPAHASKSWQQKAVQPRSGFAGRILVQQRAGGNQAALQLLERKQGPAERAPADGRLKAPIAPEGLLGHQSEQVAAVVTSSPLPPQPPLALHPEPDFEKTHQRTIRQKLAGPATAALTEVPAVVRDVICSPGEQLDAATRASFEPRFGFDFSAVRVHRDAQAAESARAVDARAYTVGNHIVFGDRWAIEHTQNGQATLAHELAHVIQQNRGGSERPEFGGGALEQAADAAAAAFIAGRSSIWVGGASAPGLARQPVSDSEGQKPRSLRESLKADALADWALAEEIDLISEWLLFNPSSGVQHKQLSDELARLEGEQWRRNQKAEKKQRRQEAIAKVVQAVDAGRIPVWLPVFPFLPTHGLGALMPWDWEFDAAPIMARREGDSIVVQQPINSVKNTRRFAKDVRSIERNVYGNVFSNQGGRLRPDQLVGVRLYDEGEKVVVVEARQLLEFARASDRAVYVNIVATALSAGSGVVAGKVASSVATRSFATRLAVNTVTGAGLGLATGASSSAIVDAGYVYSGDISGKQLASNAWEAGKSGAKYGAAFGAGGTVVGAAVGRFSPNAKLPAPSEGTTAPLNEPSGPLVEIRTSKTLDYGKPEASGSPRVTTVTTTRPMRRPPGGALRGSMGGGVGDPVAYPRSAPTVEVRGQRTLDLGEPNFSVSPQTPGPDPWAAPATKPATLRGPQRLSSDPAVLEKINLEAERLHSGVSAADPMWKAYTDYFKARLNALKQGDKVNAPLPWEGYRAFRSRVSPGVRTEGEILAAYGFEKNSRVMESQNTKIANFIPDGVAGNPAALKWGKSYHFAEIKDWKNMSDTGNLSAMLDYVDMFDGSRLTIYYKSSTYMSGPLRSKIESLIGKGKVNLMPFVGEK